MKNELETTTNNSVYKKLYKEKYASCSYCKWHSQHSENDAWDNYSISKAKNSREKRSYPNWKLVSKNKKQWMKKPLKFKKYISNYWEYYYYILW